MRILRRLLGILVTLIWAVFFFTNTFFFLFQFSFRSQRCCLLYLLCPRFLGLHLFEVNVFTSCLRLFSSELESSAGSEKEEAGSGNLLEEPRPRTTRPWTPLSIFNSDYVTLLKEREQTLIRHDFIKENIVSQHKGFATAMMKTAAPIVSILTSPKLHLATLFYLYI